MNILKYTFLVLLAVFSLCSCGSTDSAGRSAPLINVTVNKGTVGGPGYRPAAIAARPRPVNGVVLGATHPYLRVGTCHPDPYCGPAARPQVRPHVVRVISDDGCVARLLLSNGRIVQQPSHHQQLRYTGSGGNYPGYGVYRDPYGPRERFNPFKYGSMPDGQARSNPMNGTFDGFLANPENAYFTRGVRRR